MCHHDTHPQSNRTVNQSQPLAFVHKFAWGMFEYQNIVIESNAAGIKFDTQRHRHLWISALGCRFHGCHGEGIWWKFILKHLRPRMAHKINAIHSLGHVSTISFTTVSIYYMKWTPLQNVTWSNVAFGMEQLLFFASCETLTLTNVIICPSWQASSALPHGQVWPQVVFWAYFDMIWHKSTSRVWQDVVESGLFEPQSNQQCNISPRGFV